MWAYQRERDRGGAAPSSVGVGFAVAVEDAAQAVGIVGTESTGSVATLPPPLNPGLRLNLRPNRRHFQRPKTQILDQVRNGHRSWRCRVWART